MPDKPLPILPAWVPFDHKIPLVGVDPDDLSAPTTVCFNSAWLPYVLGVLGALTRAEIWDTEDFLARNTEALRGEHLLSMFMGECDVQPQTLVSTSDNGCGFKVSYDGGATWQDFDLSGCIADIVGSGIDTAIENGIIPSSSVSPVEPPFPFETCHTYHIQMTAADAFKLPVVLSPGDTVRAYNTKGQWSDYKLGIFSLWMCPDGKEVTLGVCLSDRVPLYSDPNQSAWHMELMLQVGNNYYLPLRDIVTIPGSIPPNSDAVFVPNYDRTPLGQGTISFDVEVCRAEAGSGWCNYFDLTNGNPGSPISDVWGTFDERGLETVNGYYMSEYLGVARAKITLPNAHEVTNITAWYEIDSNGSCGGGLQNELGIFWTYNGNNAVAGGILRRNIVNGAHVWSGDVVGNFTDFTFYITPSNCYYAQYQGAGRIIGLRLRGASTSPWGASDCV